LQSEIDRLNALGIIHGIRHQRQLDEAPSAYKDIDIVMANQKDLVEPIVELSPIAVIKGD
jgi:tRNA-splicing ligase RtcB